MNGGRQEGVTYLRSVISVRCKDSDDCFISCRISISGSEKFSKLNLMTKP